MKAVIEMEGTEMQLELVIRDVQERYRDKVGAINVVGVER